METVRVKLRSFTLRQTGWEWEYHFDCPICGRKVVVSVGHPPMMIPCPSCKGVVDGSEARVELEAEVRE
jgi:hypothetical protein